MKKNKKVRKIKLSYVDNLSQTIEQNRLQEAFRYMISNLFDPGLTIGQIKNRYKIKSFAAKFSLVTGHKPKSFILYHRIAASKLLLLQTNATITEVAISVGFSSLSAFDNTFKRKEGQKPSTWLEIKMKGVF